MTTSLLTLLIFVYYASDITAEMTSGPPQIEVRNIGDVITKGYIVVTVTPYYKRVLAQSDPNSGSYQVYKKYLEPVKEFPDKDISFNRIVSEEKTLLFTVETDLCQNYAEPYRKQLVVLKLDEKYSSFGTLALTNDSEFLPLFNFYILTAYESGINKKISGTTTIHCILTNPMRWQNLSLLPTKM